VSKRRIVIVGGGVAGLTAAFELTRTRKLRAQHDVTIYQLGWRAGGKCASGRDDEGRNIEHGLHVWFGFYENAFRLVRKAYRLWSPPSDQRIKTPEQAFQPHKFTLIGNGDVQNPGIYDVEFPCNDNVPGKGDVALSAGACLANILNLVSGFHDHTLRANKSVQAADPTVTLDGASLSLLARRRHLTGQSAAKPQQTVQSCLKIAATSLSQMDEELINFGVDDIELVRKMLFGASSAVRKSNLARTRGGDLLVQVLDLALAFIVGIITDILIEQRSIAEMDGEDFRHWLIRHGADPAIAGQSPLAKALYDTMFQYPGGRLENASYGAGTAAQVVLRMLATYKGAFAWTLQAGAGEVFIAPLFDVLRKRCVKFKFFHKLTDIQIARDGNAIASLCFDRQVNLTIPESEYEPVKMAGGLRGWGAAPDWSVIEDNEKLEAAHVDLESYWCQQRVGPVPLKRGDDFDDVILAVPPTAFRDLGHEKRQGGEQSDSETGPNGDLFELCKNFVDMTEKLQLVPSLSVQLWSNKSLFDLGWDKPPPALVSGPDPLDIWADMSQLLVYEPHKVEPAPMTLHYLCDVLRCSLYKQPPSQTGVQEAADNKARILTVCWLNNRAGSLWPKARQNDKFDWNVLYAPATAVGEARLDAQHIRANISPVDCCVATAAGTTAWRLRTDASGVDHLFLAGTWIDTGFSTECVEAAVMSGMQAARAIVGDQRDIPGERFLHASRQYVSLCDIWRQYAYGT
jgi:uncharacterized protein with NAD-binding domain and iron-sulfur cluster